MSRPYYFTGLDPEIEVFDLLRATQDVDGICIEQALDVCLNGEDIEDQNPNAIAEVVEFFRDWLLPFARVYGGEHGRFAMAVEELITRLTGEEE